VIKAESDFLMHLVTACSDALGGMGQMYGNMDDLSSMSGFTGHLKHRAQIFSRKKLTPDFSQDINEKNLVCVYKDSDGGTYKYSDDGKIQKMTGPDNKELYARVDKTSELSTKLFIPNWPAFSDGKVFGLNPEKRYALFQGLPGKTDLKVLSMPENITVSRYYSDKNFAILVLDKVTATAPSKGEISLEVNSQFNQICNNGKIEKIDSTLKAPFQHKLQVEFPAYLLLSTNIPPAKTEQNIGDEDTIVRLVDIIGIAETSGKIKNLLRFSSKVPGEDKMISFFMLTSGKNRERTIDFLIKIPDDKSAVKLYLKNNNASGYGNGTIAKVFLNGKLIKDFDCTRINPAWKKEMPSKEKNLWDTDYHEWVIPAGEFKEKNLLFTIAVDSKNDNNSDNQLFSMPMLVKSEGQKFTERVCK
jgi:hypothetical protein